MLRLALQTLRLRKASFIASFIALWLGATIVMICGGLMETGIRTALPPQRLADAAVVVAGPQDYGSKSMTEQVRLDSGLVDTVRHVPGVAAAIPDVSFPATLLAAHGSNATGHGWQSARLAPYQLSAGSAPAGPADVVLDAKLAQANNIRVGDQVTLLAGAGAAHGTGRFRVTGIAAASGVSAPAMFFTDDEANQLYDRPGLVDNIGVLANPGTDPDQLAQAITAALPANAAVTLTGDDRGQAEFAGANADGSKLISLAGVFGGLATTVAIFVVGSTVGLSIQLRMREMALLRAVGTTPNQLRRMVVGETMLVAIPATALGFLPGSALGGWLLNQFAAHGLVPTELVYHQGWIPTVSAIGVGLLTGLLAGLVAARTATRVRPTEALAESALPTRWLSWFRVLCAVLCLAGGTALALVTMLVMTGPVAASTAGPSAMLWAIGLALLAPGLTRICTAILRWPLRALSGTSGYLAMLNANARKLRMASAVTPIMLAVGLATAMLYLQTSQVSATEKSFTDSLRADAVLTSATGSLPVSLAGTAATLPGVAGASAYVTSTGFYTVPPVNPNDKHAHQAHANSLALVGLSADGAAATTAYQVTQGSLADLRGNTMALPSSDLQPGRELGDTVSMHLGDNATVQLRVVAVFTPARGIESVLLPADLLAAHTTNGLAQQILVKAAPGTDPATLTATLHGLAAQQPGLLVADRASVSAAFASREQTGVWINYLLVGAIVGYTIISLVNTLIMATGERRREFALQRLVGSTRLQVLRMMTVEAALVAIIGVLLGTAVALLTLLPFGVALNGSALPDGPPWLYLGIAAGGVVLTLASTLVPTWLSLRYRPVEAAAVLA